MPIITHVHGGHSKVNVDGNPEHHFTNNYEITEFTYKNYLYNNDQPAGTLWYHDHTIYHRYVRAMFIHTFVISSFVHSLCHSCLMHIFLTTTTTTGITHLTTYAGLAGFYIVRDELDNGATVNHLLNF